MKLAETRLENRTNRPHIELTSDLPLDGLIAEVNAIKQSIQMLEDKLDNARFEILTLFDHDYMSNFAPCRETLSDLQQHLHDLKDDHMRKSQALSLDQRCVDARSKLLTHDPSVQSQTERNMKLTGTLRKTSRFLENSTVVR